MDKFLTRYSWTLNLLALAAIAFFSARGVGEIVASSASEVMRGPEGGQAAPAITHRIRSPRRSFSKPDGTPILERNIFDSIVGPVLPNAEDTDEVKPVGDGQLPLVPCPAGQTKLLSTIASSNNPAWSFASVQAGQNTMLYRVGDQLDGRTVMAISWRYLLLRGATDECYYDLFGDEGSLTRERPRMTGEATDPSLAAGIEVNGENERTVKRSLVDPALANPSQFARSVRVRPYMQDGENKGFRIRKIEKGSPLEMLGAQRGDIIHAVNGVELTSVDKALAAYQSLRSEDKLTFSITRRGQPMDLVINIR